MESLIDFGILKSAGPSAGATTKQEERGQPNVIDEVHLSCSKPHHDRHQCFS